MSPANTTESDEAVRLLAMLRHKGVLLWVQDERLHYKASKGVLTNADIEEIGRLKTQLMSLMASEPSASTDRYGLTDGGFSRVPLAFTQLAHWNQFRLNERPGIRSLSSARRLHGCLDLDALRASIANICQRHAALRTRIKVVDGVPIQEIADREDCRLDVVDLRSVVDRMLDAEVGRCIDKLILDHVEMATGPLFVSTVLILREKEHLLMMAMEHSIGDMFSLSILWREIFLAYSHAVKGSPPILPVIPVQFAEYAAQQRTKKGWIAVHRRYWLDRVAECRPLRFPDSSGLASGADSAWATIPFRIESSLKSALEQWCRLERTTLALAVFTAYAALVLRWCSVKEGVIRYQSDGRRTQETMNTVGYFASALYVRVEVSEEDRLRDLLSTVTEAYCEAYEHADFSYLAAQVPAPQFTSNTLFNWVPEESSEDGEEISVSESLVASSRLPFAHPMMRTLELYIDPFVLLFDTHNEVSGDIYFPLNRFSIESMESFRRNFLSFITALLSQPDEAVSNISPE